MLCFFTTAEGFYDYKNSKYIYQYKDHLGNARVSYGRNAVTNEAEILDRNDYYPFGMNFQNVGGSDAGSIFDARGGNAPKLVTGVIFNINSLKIN